MPVMEFVGVSTAGSSIHQLFPRWAAALGLEGVTLAGTDVPPDSDPVRYRDVLARIAADQAVRGALVTSHKVGLFQAAGDMFDELDRYAQLCGEVSCVSKRGGRLIGHAKDPLTAAPALRAMLAEDHFAGTGAEVLCFGAGGAGMALTVHLLGREDRPQRIVLADTRTERLDKLRSISALLDHHGATVDTVHVRGHVDTDGLLAARPPGSLVINATGMGKDVPGSPISDDATFPTDGVVWDLNYRGGLEFLQQARAYATSSAGSSAGGREASQVPMRVYDGWLYFLHGWAQHTAEIFGLAMTPELFDRLRAIAEAWREGRAHDHVP